MSAWHLHSGVRDQM